MARNNPTQVQEIIKTPKNKDFIQGAINHEDALLFHGEPVLEKSKFSPAYRRWLDWVNSFLKDADKLDRIDALLTAPNPNVTSCKSIFDELGKVFETDDKNIKYEFITDEIEADAADYIQKLDDGDFWEIEGFNALKKAPCSLIVIDLPSLQLTEKPEPYHYLLSIRAVKDLNFLDKGLIDYVLFERKDKKLVYIDEQSYMLFEKKEQTAEYSFLSSAQHSTYNDQTGQLIDGIGYTPVTSFYDSPIAGTNYINKTGPISASLSNLDWLLFWKISKKYLDAYGAWPIIVSYQKKCEYKDAENNYCEGGFINYITYSVVDGERTEFLKQKRCPVCEKKGFIGAGSHWTVPVPQDSDQVDLMENPIKIIVVPQDSLNGVRDEQIRLENEIYMDSVGWDGDAMNKQAVNDTQVSANYESKKSVLDSIQKQFERVRKFTLETEFKIRYGSYFVRLNMFLGRNYFLQSVDELTDSYTKAKDAGLPQYMIANLRDQITRNQSRNNSEQAERDWILSNLEPYIDYTPEQLILMQVQYSDPVGYAIKINFNTFIQQFEREYMNIIEFGSLISFKDKISAINSKLQEYGKAKGSVPQPNTGSTQGRANGSN